MKSYKDMIIQINEVLKKSDSIETWISDFVHSDAPQFKGKSKEKRIEMAKAAYYAAQKDEGVIQPNGTDKVVKTEDVKKLHEVSPHTNPVQIPRQYRSGLWQGRQISVQPRTRLVQHPGLP